MITQNDPRRWKERADGSMVFEDKSAMANLSPSVMMREIPHNSVAIDPHTGDTPNFGKPDLSMAFFSVVKGR
jgi:hypothetical protein